MIKSKIVFIVILLCSISSLAVARPIAFDVSTNHIDIDTNFTGAEVLLFGAQNAAGDIIVVIRGAKRDYLVSKKERFLGIWHNKKPIKFSNVYSFYHSIMTKQSNKQIAKQTLEYYQIGDNTKTAIFDDLSQDDNLSNALLHNLKSSGLVTSTYDKAEFFGEGLFKLHLLLPRNIPPGSYTIEIYLINDNQVSAFQALPLNVGRTGFEYFVNRFAHDHPFVYGLIAIIFALLSGLAASYVFSKIKKRVK